MRFTAERKVATRRRHIKLDVALPYLKRTTCDVNLSSRKKEGGGRAERIVGKVEARGHCIKCFADCLP